MNTREQNENELKHTRKTLEAIEECIGESRTDEDGDMVIPEYWATRLIMLLGDV